MTVSYPAETLAQQHGTLNAISDLKYSNLRARANIDLDTQPKAQPIRLMALDYDRLFDKCLNRFGKIENYSPLLEISKSIEECYGRFDGWATFMGVFAGPQACLDYRVRDRPELQDIFIRFLEVLRRNLFLGTYVLDLW